MQGVVRRWAIGLAITVFAVMVTIARADASPLELFGLGARSPALAGTGVATSEDFESVYLNPAGLADVRRRRVSLGVMAGDLDLKVDGSSDNASSTRALIFGATVPIPLGGWWRDRLTLGIGAHTPREALAAVDVPAPGEAYFAVVENRSSIVGVQLGAGLRLDSRFSIGASVLALAALRGHLFLDIDGADRFTTQSTQRLTTHLAPIVAARYRSPNATVQAGLTVRAPSRSDYDIEIQNDLGDSLPLTLPTLRIAGVAQYDPLAVAAEIAWLGSDAWTLTAHLTLSRWSAYPRPTQNPVLGGQPPPEPAFRDTATPRISIQKRWKAGPTTLVLRSGYAFVMSPATEQSGRGGLFDSHRHLMSAGAGLEISSSFFPATIDVWLQRHDLSERRLSGAPEMGPADARTIDGSIHVGGVSMELAL